MKLRAIIAVHAEHEGPGLLQRHLREAGFELVLRFRQLEPEDKFAPLLVVMGGPMAAYEAERFPFLASELRLLQARLELGGPCLGICLGAQLLAAAAGANVHPGEMGFELGVFPVSLTTEASADPVFRGMPSKMSFAHWHQDAFDPVPGGVRLASTERYREQAFRIGDSYGLQFHPELDAATFGDWLLASPRQEVQRSGRSVLEIIETDLPQLRASQQMAEELLERIARRFAQSCSRFDEKRANRRGGHASG